MGLAERRATQAFQTDELPKLQAEIDEAAGMPLPVEVHWEQLATDGEAYLYHDSWKGVFFEPLIAALKEVGRDQIGKDALRQGLHRVVIESTGNGSSDHWAQLEGGTLTLDHLPTANAADVGPRSKSLVRVLEAGL